MLWWIIVEYWIGGIELISLLRAWLLLCDRPASSMQPGTKTILHSAIHNCACSSVRVVSIRTSACIGLILWLARLYTECLALQSCSFFTTFFVSPVIQSCTPFHRILSISRKIPGRKTEVQLGVAWYYKASCPHTSTYKFCTKDNRLLGTSLKARQSITFSIAFYCQSPQLLYNQRCNNEYTTHTHTHTFNFLLVTITVSDS